MIQNEPSLSPDYSSDVPVLEARGIDKRFPGVLALDAVDLRIHAGTVHGLIGENGAGKSTLMHILAGAQRPDGGEILLDGQPVQFANTREALDRRISIVYQELNLVPHLTVAENIFLGRELRDRFGLIRTAEQNRQSRELLARLDPSIDPRTEACRLRVGQQQIVEIAKALGWRARVIFMDEPTSAISDQEVETLFELIDSLSREGIAVVYVSHKLDELLRITNLITVLRDGRLTGTVQTEQTDQEEVVRLMTGRELGELFVRTPASPGDAALQVEGLGLQPSGSSTRAIEDFSLTVHAGEVVGVFGLMGAGRTEMLEAVYGLHPGRVTGSVSVGGSRCEARSPAEAMRRGIGMVPEDRKSEGLVLQASVLDNIGLSSLAKRNSGPLISNSAERDHAAGAAERLRIKTPSLAQMVENLSGGNQQKVVLAKVLGAEPRVILLDEPTRGIDVNAKREIYQLIDELKKQGLAIVVVTSEIPELLGIADRIVVMREGRRTAEFSNEEANQQAILRAAVPGATADA